jgi:hypothetical protein
MKRIKINLFIVLLLTSFLTNASVELRVVKKTTTKPNQFTNLNDAVEAARKLRTTNYHEDIKIVVEEGEYQLAKPIFIGSSLNRLSIEAAKGANVVIKGTQDLNLKWEKYQNGIYKAKVGTHLNQLVVNGKLKTLARFPNINPDQRFWNGYTSLMEAEKRIKTYKNPRGVILHTMHRGLWGGFHYKVQSVYNGNIDYSGGFQNNRPSPKHQKYNMVENALEELDAPGEWFLSGNTLFYYPEKNEDINKLRVEAVKLKSFINVVGTETNPVEDFSINGITFKFSSRTLFERFEQLLRSDWCMYRGAVLFFENSKNSSVKNCTFEYLEGNVILMSRYNENNLVYGNHIHDCGASGISFVGDHSAVRSPSYTYHEYVPYDELDLEIGPKNNQYPRNCTADNNLIYRTGTIENQTAGVQIAMAMDIKVSHNSIYDVPRSGINVGDGTWGGHIIEYNDVFKTVQASSDHGSFNSWGRDRFWIPNHGMMDKLTAQNPSIPFLDAIHTSKIRYNRMKCEHGWDIDLDDGSSNYEVYSNLCLRGGIKLREGFFRKVYNNVCVNNSFHPHVWFKTCGDQVYSNIFTTRIRDIRLASWGTKFDENIYVSKDQLEYSQSKGVGKNSIYTNPHFVNPVEGDFRVKSTSKALKSGFQNFDMDKFGVQVPALKAIAKTPVIPALVFETDFNSGKEIKWLGAKIKNISSVDEASAYGLPGAWGVELKDLSPKSPLTKSGFKDGDVVVNVAGVKAINISKLMNTYDGENWKGQFYMTVFRNQKEHKILLKLR